MGVGGLVSKTEQGGCGRLETGEGGSTLVLGKICFCSQRRGRPRQGDQREVWGGHTGQNNRGLTQGPGKWGVLGCRGHWGWVTAESSG